MALRYTILESLLTELDDEKQARLFVRVLQDVMLTTQGQTLDKDFIGELLKEYGFALFPNES